MRSDTCPSNDDDVVDDDYDDDHEDNGDHDCGQHAVWLN